MAPLAETSCASMVQTLPVEAAFGDAIHSSSEETNNQSCQHPALSYLVPATPGVRIYTDGMSKEYQQDAVSRIVAVTTLLLYLGTFHIVLGFLIASFWSRFAACGLALIVASVMLPPGPLLWPEFLDNYVFKTWRQYFKYSYTFEQQLDRRKRYIMAGVPHGVYPMSHILATTLRGEVWPGLPIYALAANSVFSVPLWRNVMTWIGAVPATARNLKAMLQRGSVAIVVGGIAEMFRQFPTHEEVTIRNRKGFVRVAVAEGIEILPVYHFGNTQLLDWRGRSLEQLSRQWRVCMGYATGVWGLPLPRKQPLWMVVGKPIAPPKVSPEDPNFEPTVNVVHAQVLQNLQDLYDRHKGTYGWEHRPLVLK